jgi:hypothetical protein
MPLGDVSQTNRAQDWLAPNLIGMPQALPFNPWPEQYWDPSTQGITTEILFSRATLYATPVSPSTTHRAGYFCFWEPSRSLPESQSFTHPVSINSTAPIVLPSYLLLVDHYLTSGYAVAGTTITEGIDVPIGWIPTLGVDPLNAPAIQAFWNAGPRALADSEASREFYPVIGRIFRRPVVYWTRTNLPVTLTTDSGVILTSEITGLPLTADAGTPNSYILTGPGASLGVKNV